MIEEIKRQFTSINILIALLIIAVGAYVIQLLWSFFNLFADVFIILISAWLISFILEPLVEKLRTVTKLSKVFAAAIVYLAFFALLTEIIMYFIPLVSAQLQSLVQVLPHYVNTAPSFIHKWVDIVASYMDNSLPIISGVAQFVFDLFLALIISFYFVVDKEVINKEFYNLTPKKWRKYLASTQALINTTFASFLRMQVVFAILSGIGTWIVLRIFNVDYAASIALLAGILTLIPLVGPVLALIPPLLLPALTNTTQAIFIFIILILIQQIIFSVIGPKLMSKAFKLHPIIVLLSFIVGYKVAGGLGAIFAIPVLGIVAVLLHKIGQHYMEQNQS